MDGDENEVLSFLGEAFNLTGDTKTLVHQMIVWSCNQTLSLLLVKASSSPAPCFLLTFAIVLNLCLGLDCKLLVVVQPLMLLRFF